MLVKKASMDWRTSGLEFGEETALALVADQVAQVVARLKPGGILIHVHEYHKYK